MPFDGDLDKLIRSEFPITADWAYLNNATYGPLPACHVAAAKSFLDRMSEMMMDDLVDEWVAKVDEVRGLGARLLHCSPDDVAILRGTTEGLGLVAEGLSWNAGDEVITYDLEFPSDVYPFLNLSSRGVQTKFIADRGRYRFDLDDILQLVSDRTRVICLSVVNFAHGFRAPIEEIGQLCRDRGIWLVLDAVQALGALTVDVSRIEADVVSAHGYKFLLSGLGVSLCYCSPRARKELRVAAPGWKSVRQAANITNMLDYSLEFPDSARRFEAGIQNMAGVRGMSASLELMLKLGTETIERHVLGLCDLLAEGLTEIGFSVISSRKPAERSCIIAAVRPGLNSAAVKSALTRGRVACAVREGRIRISPHLYNNREDVERLLQCLSRLV